MALECNRYCATAVHDIMPSSPPSSVRQPTARQPITVADFRAYEHRYQLRHRFLTPRNRRLSPGHPVVSGHVDERQPEPGFQIVGSDLTVHHSYEAHARPDAPTHVSVIVLFEGRAELELAGTCRTIGAGESLLVTHDGAQPFCARHVVQPRVLAVNVTVTAAAIADDPRFAALEPLVAGGAGFVPLRIASALRQSLADWLVGAPNGPDTLLAEGLALQLLACGATQGLPAERIPAAASALSRRDMRLVSRVRTHIERHPDEVHTLTGLACLACMSSSSLREKFRLAYGCSVFDYLREYRLSLARRFLYEGVSVQQAAARVGYRHSTNFATAFRRRYGIAPSEVI